MAREPAASASLSVLGSGVELAPVGRQGATGPSQRALQAAAAAVLPGTVDPASENLAAGNDGPLPSRSQSLTANPLAAASATATVPASTPLMTLERLQLMQDAGSKSSRSLPAADAVDGGRRSARQQYLQLEGAFAMDPAALRTQTPEAQRAEGVLSRADNAMAEQALPQLARDVLRMAAQNATQLRLQLNPEELGALDVRLRVDGDRVHVSVVAQQGLTRELLEAQLPQLKNLLAEGGLELGDVDVRQQGDRDQQARRAATQGEGPTAANGAGPEIETAATVAPQPAGGRLIDAFA